MDIRQFLSLIAIFLSLTLVTSGALAESSPKIPNANKHSLQDKAKPEGKKEVSPEVKKLVSEAEKLKLEMIQLNRDLYKLEEKLLYPTETQLSVFLSLNPKSTFSLDSIELRLDDTVIATHLYSDSEINALRKGGIQRIYLGSLADGRHKITAQFNGEGANNNYYRRKKALKFTKENKAKFIQMEIGENSQTKEPLFKVKQW